MSLRDSLRAAVARCEPHATQHATPGTDSATGPATTAQQAAAIPRKCSVASATDRATAAQQTSCATIFGDAFVAAPVAPVARGALTSHRLTASLIAAIKRTCDARGDDADNRAALIAECLSLPADAQADLLAHFTLEAARWESANRRPWSPLNFSTTGELPNES